MAKTHGMESTITVDDSAGTARDISNDITNFDVATPRESQDTTGIDKTANERLQLRVDANVSMSGVLNTASNMSHDVLKTLSSTIVVRTVDLTIGNSGPNLAMEMVGNEYKINRDASGSTTWDTTFDLQNGAAPTWA